MCRYGTRPAFAHDRLAWTADGQIAYRLKRPWPDGRTALVLPPGAFLRRLCGIIPARGCGLEAVPEKDALDGVAAGVMAEVTERADQLVTAARQEPREDLEDYAAEGGLFSILIDARWAGIAAVFRATEYGLRGYCVGELVLTAETRGGGFARSIQQRLASPLTDRGDDVLFGHIHPVNLAAQRSARAAGRHDVGGILWMPRG